MMNEPAVLSVELRMAELRKLISKSLKNLENRLKKQSAEHEEASSAEKYRQIADSLLADPAAAPRGSGKTLVLNVHSMQLEEASLNPKFDFRENAELLYRKARKGLRGREIIKKKIAETEAGIKRLKQVQNDLKNAENAEEQLKLMLCDRLETEFVIRHPAQCNAAQPGSAKTPDVPFRHYLFDKWDVFIGKNNEQNDELSIHFAKPCDVWLHVAAHAGSHVIIRRSDRKETVPKEIIEKAASLSVWFSKAKHTSWAEVHVTEARFVRKRRHAPPGEVIAERCKTVRVRPKAPAEFFPGLYDPDTAGK